MTRQEWLDLADDYEQKEEEADEMYQEYLHAAAAACRFIADLAIAIDNDDAE